MKILFAGYRNPHFITVTEYAEKAFVAAGADVYFFHDREFFLPGRILQKFPFLAGLELNALNRRLLKAAEHEGPDMFFACGGLRILPSALSALRTRGITTVLWTIDAPSSDFRLLLEAAPFYDHIFCGGSEAVELFRAAVTRAAKWLPFACDPDFHKKKELSGEEQKKLGCDICFIGTLDPHLYPGRFKLLEGISELDLKVWGPGAEAVPSSSPLRKRVMGGQLAADQWTKIYSASKIAVCSHYSDLENKYPCYQASPRVYEAMACGAFLLCDAQKDVMAQFEDGKHLVIFRNAAELREKAEYYLANPDKRLAIAAAGREEVLKKHTYRHRMADVLRVYAET